MYKKKKKAVKKNAERDLGAPRVKFCKKGAQKCLICAEKKNADPSRGPPAFFFFLVETVPNFNENYNVAMLNL